ncbi:hypothetical protein DUI87_16650 [Hirundo rustica rustica]|uniref:Uncharacterized protein n=1 Tax=Hirundo rustica rustica TaxID=333673 RepID=A0A3M0K7A9_HIRRU|nr:hypothetical protein DUI87_16650 [Hirundo rustica rustica]
MLGFLAWECTLPCHVQPLIHQHSEVLLSRAAPNPSSAQPVSVLGITLTQVQDLALGLVELREICSGSPPKPAQVPLDGIPPLQRANHTQLGVICKLAEGALDPTVHEIVKQHWSQWSSKKGSIKIDLT